MVARSRNAYANRSGVRRVKRFTETDQWHARCIATIASAANRTRA
jgi:hypothetical protein